MDTDYMDDIHVALQSLLLLARMEELRPGSAADYSGAALDWDNAYMTCITALLTFVQ